ncbi:peptidoglycan-binding domain-containing protein [Tropicimonas sp. IMCC34043]|uniref:peptidoglycan-binding domain-containing protein n=1 Tax=Tropicimonas sp. IMCC34043 TaxID=2248760 RepID=UPI000E272492|nr:peptidoglycan-binding protein [Tropicimonas sp. IMCC34043]
MLRNFAVAAATAALVSVPAPQASAGNNFGKVAAGAAVGLGIACVTGVICKKQQQTTQRAPSSGGTKKKAAPQMSAAERAQRQENKDVQTALNAFGFNVGTPDGVFGKNTYAGMRDYQAFMGYPVTGELDPYQKQFLLESQQRAVASGAYPTRDMLKAYQNEARGYSNGYGAPNGANPGTGYNDTNGYAGNGGYNTNGGYNGNDGYAGNGAYGGSNGYPVPPPAVVPPMANQPVPATTDIKLPILPTRSGGLVGSGGGSMADRCELVDLLSQSSGVIQAVNITDPDQALSQQFCAMRGYAISEGQSVMAAYGVDDESMRSEVCGPIALQMAETGAMTGESSPQVAAAKAAEITRGLGVDDPSAARDYGRMCLSVGYRVDDPELAAGGALMMLGQGDYAYAEVIAHHLREGFGVPANSAAAVPWYETTITTLERGGQPAFLPTQSAGRVAVMRNVLAMGGMQAANDGVLPGAVPVSTGPVLPVLKKGN